MIELRVFGEIALRAGDGRELEGLLRQPKRLALLFYLALPRAGHWHRRDVILTTFWPDRDEARGRMALRNALYVLRQALGADVIRTRGDDEVAIDPAHFVCDAALLDDDIAHGRARAALARYRGEALPGLNVPDADGFDRWLDDQRARWREGVGRAAATLRDEAMSRGDATAAIAWQRRVADLAPYSEQEARALIELLAATGEVGGALESFERLRERLAQDFGVGPSAETQAVVAALRVAIPADEQPAPMAAALPEAIQPRAPDAPMHAQVTAPVRHLPWRLAGGTCFAVLLLAWAFHSRPASVAQEPRTLLFYPLFAAADDSALGYLREGLPAEIAHRLAAIGGVHAIAVATNDTAAVPSSRRDVIVRGTVRAQRDSVLVALTLTASTNSRPITLPVLQASLADVPDAAGALAAAVVGAIHRAANPAMPRPSARRVDPEAFRLTLIGWQLLLGQGTREHDDALLAARASFRAAIDHDPSYSRAWAGLSSTWASAAATGRAPLDAAISAGEAAARHALALDSLEGTAWANLGVLLMLRERSLAAADSFFTRAIATEPSNAELYMIRASALGWAWKWKEARDPIRAARALDPLSSYYVGREASLAFCDGDADRALPLYRAQLALNPEEREGRVGVARALAAAGRWDEAATAFAPLVGGKPASSAATGAAGYWALRQIDGERILAARIARANRAGVQLSPYLLAAGEIAAGHRDSGFVLLDAAARNGDWMLVKLPCNPDLDGVRDDPRYRRLLHAVTQFGFSSR